MTIHFYTEFFMSDIDAIVAQLEVYDIAYDDGDSLVPDAQYDAMKRDAFKRFPTHPYFMTVGATVRGGKVKLPYTMGSLDQKYEGEIEDWVKKYSLYNEEICISHKLDGASGMERYNGGTFQISYSRGNGVLGADSSRHVKNLPSNPQTISKLGHLTVRGELIVRNDTFENRYADDYKTARAMASGCMNASNTSQNKLNDIDFIMYSVVDCDPEFETVSQSASLDMLELLGFKVVPYIIVRGSELNDDFLTKTLAKARADSPYELDGIVLTINKKSAQKNLSNSSSLNPEHSVKYKVLDAAALIETTVVKVHYEISKNGYQKPRVEINPVQLFGTTVTFATGFNGRYIVDNNIGSGTKIKITKSGSVIPYIVEIVKSTVADVPSGDWDWNDNKVEMVVRDPQNHPEVIFKQVLDFFNTLEVDLLKEASIEKVISYLKLNNSSYETILFTMLNLLEMEWEKIIGSNGAKIFASLERRLSSLTLAKYLGSLKYFGTGFGVRKAKLLLKNLTDENDVWKLSVNRIVDFEGFDVKTATKFIDGLYDAKAFADKMNLKFVQEKKTNELEHLNVVFTGFRDKEFQEKLEKSGAKVGSSVSKKTTHVLTAEPNSSSGKAVKARELGIDTLSLDEFKEKFNL
jgi:DNA ligase (NAD+)